MVEVKTVKLVQAMGGYEQLSMSGNILDYNIQYSTGRLYQKPVSELTYSYILFHEVIEVIQSYLIVM